MKRKRGGNEGERKTKWLQLDVETKRKREQIIYKRWALPLQSLCYYFTLTLFILSAVNDKTTFLFYLSLSLLLLPFPSILSQESERLEMLNSDLKAQIEELKLERQQLILMLNRHRPTCIVRTDSVKTPESEVNPLLQQLEAKWRCEFLQFTIEKKQTSAALSFASVMEDDQPSP